LADAHINCSANSNNREEIMGRQLLEQGDNIIRPGVTLPGTGSLTIKFDDTGLSGNTLAFLVLSGTTPVSIASNGAMFGENALPQLLETNNNPTTVTIKGSEFFILGSFTGQSNSGDGVVTDIAATPASPKTIHSSLTLIDASATTGGVVILAGATNTSGAGNFQNGSTLSANVTIKYTGLTIKGGSGLDTIENDAKNGIVTDGNADFDHVLLGGSGAKVTLGHGAGDQVLVGFSELVSETPGSAVGDAVKFGSASTALLVMDTGAETGSTVFTTNIGLTKVLKAADGMRIDFSTITPSSTIADETTAVKSSTNLTAAENAAVNAMGSASVAYFSFQGNEYFVATHHTETTVSSDDVIVKLVGITDIHHATNLLGLVTLHV
jgi:hypothetical protein